MLGTYATTTEVAPTEKSRDVLSGCTYTNTVTNKEHQLHAQAAKPKPQSREIEADTVDGHRRRQTDRMR